MGSLFLSLDELLNSFGGNDTSQLVETPTLAPTAFGEEWWDFFGSVPLPAPTIEVEPNNDDFPLKNYYDDEYYNADNDETPTALSIVVASAFLALVLVLALAFLYVNEAALLSFLSAKISPCRLIIWFCFIFNTTEHERVEKNDRQTPALPPLLLLQIGKYNLLTLMLQQPALLSLGIIQTPAAHLHQRCPQPKGKNTLTTF